MTNIDDLIARLEEKAAGKKNVAGDYWGDWICVEAAAALSEQRDEIARLHSELERGFLEVCVEPSIKYYADRAERAEAERDAQSKAADMIAEERDAYAKTYDALRADAERWCTALVGLWKLWSDPKWVRYKADYERGHLSYANMLDEAERPLLAAIDAAMKGRP